MNQYVRICKSFAGSFGPFSERLGEKFVPFFTLLQTFEAYLVQHMCESQNVVNMMIELAI